MHKAMAFLAAIVVSALLAGDVSAQCREHGQRCDNGRPRGVIPALFGFNADAGAAGYNGRDEYSGYAGPEVYGYWRDYGWFGPQYGAWYGPGGYTYYSRTGDYPAPFLPPPSMRGPPPGSELYPLPY